MKRIFAALLIAGALTHSAEAQFQDYSTYRSVAWSQENESSENGRESQDENEWEPELEEAEDPFEERIETERHDFTQSTKVVGRGVRQFEYGFLFTARKNGDETEQGYAAPELMYRHGLSERSEFRMRFNYTWKFIEDEDDVEGAEDLRLSLKYILTEQCQWRPESALELRTSTPSGADAITTGNWEGGIDYIYGWEFLERYSLTASTGVNTNALGDIAFLDPEADRDDRFLAWTQSFAIGKKVTEKSTAYFEWFGIFTHGREDEASLSFLNVGIDRYLSHNALIDFRIGWGLTEDADDVFAGVGGAFRF